MTRKNKQQSPVGLFIFWLLGLILLVFAVLASLIILLGWIASEMRYRSHPRTPEEADILLDREERQELADVSLHINQIEARLEQIEVEGKHLRRRKDGRFHAGSRLGVQLNSEIDSLMLDLSDCQAIRHELLSRPKERLRSWAAVLYRLIAFRWAVVAYLICLTYSLLATPTSVIYMNQMIAQWLDGYLPNLSLPIYGGIALSSIVASCVGWAAYSCYSRLIHSHYARQLPTR